MSQLKAKLPQELKEAMLLNDEQFEELEIDILNECMRFLPILNECNGVPVDMYTAWRPKQNPKGQYFAMSHSVMIDPLEVTGFKPMSKNGYRDYCLKEFGADPFIDPLLN